MRYTAELTKTLCDEYTLGATTQQLAEKLGVTERSVIAKLASMGVYKRKEYLNKLGQVPIKKNEYIERLAKLLNVNSEILESLEKVNKNVLRLLEDALTQDK
jgi:DNA-binding XRE family transcriptional regulator